MKKLIKLRDLTPEQWDNWVDNNCNLKVDCENCPIYRANCDSSEDENCWINNKDIYSDKFLDQEIEIEAPDILNEKEKKYLKAVIRPFRNRVVSVKKVECSNNSYFYFINIKIISELSPSRKENIFLPYFQNEMYKGMELNKEYTLEELGL